MNLLKIFSLYFIVFFNTAVSAQGNFQQAEMELAYHCDVMVNAAESRHRLQALEKFNEAFYKTLEQKGSFLHTFDSLKWISKKYPDDKSFRIFTWEVKGTEGEIFYFGAIQTNKDQLYILKDDLRNAESLADEEFSHENWPGALYYHVMDVKGQKGEKYYLLFGLHRWNRYENIKMAEVLFFTPEGVPYFGKPVFKKSEKGQQDVFYHRLVYKYASDAQMTINYNPGMQMIMIDHLVRKMSRIPGQGETMVPDGTYIGYQPENGIWTYIDKIVTEVMDTAPRPNPVLDNRKGKKIFGNK